jgi:3-hydroxyisobutyrate dehydrogenase-like beta-hydroxyacid dehydrogenase
MDIAVIGCGLMGSALARALAREENAVVVWNRTPERANALVGAGISVADSITDAMSGQPLVIICVSSYGAAIEACDPVRNLNGSTVVNLSTTTPTAAEQFEGWVKQRGGEYLDGAILAYPEDIGTPEAEILYAGAADTWARHEPTLMALGGASRYVSDRVSNPSILDQAIVGSFYMSALAAYVEAAAYANGRGVSADELNGLNDNIFNQLRRHMEEATKAIENDSYETDQATLGTYALSGQEFLDDMRDRGYPARMLTAAIENMDAGVRAGLGEKAFYAQAKVLRGEPGNGR